MLKSGLLRWLLLALVVIVADQVSKQMVLSALTFHQVVPVFPGFNIVLTYNEGAAFSFLAAAGGWQRHFFTLLALAVSAAIVWTLRKHHAERRLAFALSLILGGAIGNVIDRISYGHVVDFLDVYWNTAHWPAFNVADSAICVGAVLMVLDGLLKPKTADQPG